MGAPAAQVALRPGLPCEAHCPPPDLGVLELARRVLWLAVRMVDAANRDRDTGDGVGVGGHQASCASLVPAMTALWLSGASAHGPDFGKQLGAGFGFLAQRSYSM